MINIKDKAIFFFFNDTATTEIYTLSLHDALPISACRRAPGGSAPRRRSAARPRRRGADRSEEHTSELQSQSNLVCRLLLEKKKKTCRINWLLYSCNEVQAPFRSFARYTHRLTIQR